MEYNYDMQMGYYPNGRIQHKKLTRLNIGCRNGVWRSYYSLTNATLYASPYMVATVKGYTKHYYAESERIASRIGNGGLNFVDVPIVDSADYTSKLQANSAYFDTVAQNRLNTPIYTTAHLLDTMYYWKTSHGNTEPDCYWYHPDHLGSASWVTDKDGEVVQYLYYLPWGEDYKDQRRNYYSGSRYTFSAKEKDTETGLSYFGSRYYSSDLSIWLSVDPMSDKYPYQSNYVYCSNNPIKVIDPNREDEWEVNESGYIRCINNGKPDRIYAVYGTQKDEWGYRKIDVVPLDVDKSIMSTIVSKGENTTFSNLNNRDKMDDLFNFLADNTDVEWTQISVHDEFENKIDYITTSHENINTNLTPLLKNIVGNTSSQGFLDVFKHSHPNHYTGNNPFYGAIYPYTCNMASPGDKRTKDEIISRNGYVRTQPMFILRNGGKNYDY